MKKLFILVAIAALAAGGYFGYQAVFATTGDPEGTLTLYGNVDVRTVDLGFRVSGRVDLVHFEEGESVRQGDLLAELDTEPLEEDLELALAEVEQARAELSRLVNGTRPQEIEQVRALVNEREATLNVLAKEYERNRELLRDGAISKQTFDDIAARYEEARARLESAREELELALAGSRSEDIAAGRAAVQRAEARVQQTKTRLKDAKLFAPADGVILTRVTEPGTIVGRGQTVLVLSVRSPVWVRAYVPEPDLGRVAPGMEAAIITDTRPDDPYKGHVGFISPEAEFTPKNVETPELRTQLVYRMRVVVDNADQGLRQGMPVTVRLDTAKGGESAQ